MVISWGGESVNLVGQLRGTNRGEYRVLGRDSLRILLHKVIWCTLRYDLNTMDQIHGLTLYSSNTLSMEAPQTGRILLAIDLS